MFLVNKAAHDAVELVVAAHDKVEQVAVAHDKVEAGHDAVEHGVAAHDAIEHGVATHDTTRAVVGHNHCLCATFHLFFQRSTAVSLKNPV